MGILRIDNCTLAKSVNILARGFISDDSNPVDTHFFDDVRISNISCEVTATSLPVLIIYINDGVSKARSFAPRNINIKDVDTSRRVRALSIGNISDMPIDATWKFKDVIAAPLSGLAFLVVGKNRSQQAKPLLILNDISISALSLQFNDEVNLRVMGTQSISSILIGKDVRIDGEFSDIRFIDMTFLGRPITGTETGRLVGHYRNCFFESGDRRSNHSVFTASSTVLAVGAGASWPRPLRYYTASDYEQDGTSI